MLLRRFFLDCPLDRSLGIGAIKIAEKPIPQMRMKADDRQVTSVFRSISAVIRPHRPSIDDDRIAVQELHLQLVEMEAAEPAIELHGLGRQAANDAEVLDHRAKCGHYSRGVVVHLDRARKVGRARLNSNFARVNLERKRCGHRIVGFFLELVGNHGRLLFLG